MEPPWACQSTCLAGTSAAARCKATFLAEDETPPPALPQPAPEPAEETEEEYEERPRRRRRRSSNRREAREKVKAPGIALMIGGGVYVALGLLMALLAVFGLALLGEPDVKGKDQEDFVVMVVYGGFAPSSASSPPRSS